MAYEKIENKVRDTIKKYNLFSKKDYVLVACSGGKDSTTLAHILKKLGYNINAITINPSIKARESSSKNIENLRKFCKENEIRLYEYSFKEEFGHTLFGINKILKSKGIDMPYCTICGILKRYLLNKKSKELKADKVATGHVLDDEAESVFMNLLRGNIELLSRLGPISGVKKSKKFVPRVKPLYFCKEEEIISYSKKKKFPVAYERCPYAKSSYREIVRNELIDFQRKNKKTNENIIKWFLQILPDIKKEFEKQGEISFCEICEEPSKNKICNACSIITKIR